MFRGDGGRPVSNRAVGSYRCASGECVLMTGDVREDGIVGAEPSADRTGDIPLEEAVLAV